MPGEVGQLNIYGGNTNLQGRVDWFAHSVGRNNKIRDKSEAYSGILLFYDTWTILKFPFKMESVREI